MPLSPDLLSVLSPNIILFNLSEIYANTYCCNIIPILPNLPDVQGHPQQLPHYVSDALHHSWLLPDLQGHSQQFHHYFSDSPALLVSSICVVNLYHPTIFSDFTMAITYNPRCMKFYLFQKIQVVLDIPLLFLQ